MAGGRPAGTVGLALVLPRLVAVELLDDQRRHEQLQLALELQDTQGHDPLLAISAASYPIGLWRAQTLVAMRTPARLLDACPLVVTGIDVGDYYDL